MNNHYNSNLREFAHELRTETVSRAEKHLWKAALSRNRMGVKFKRQRPIYHFIVDFFSQEIGLIIEIDDNSHSNKGEYDFYRQQKIRELGYTIIRFSEGAVLQDVDAVVTQLQHIIYSMKKDATQLPPP
jgi:very-short-patch-repair endonuclease